MSNQTKKPPMGGMGPGKGPMTMEKAKDFKGTTNKLIKNYLSKYKISVVIVMIFAIGGTIFSIVGPKILGNATTEIYNGLISKLLKNTKYYTFGENKNEQASRAYWARIKGEENV